MRKVFLSLAAVPLLAVIGYYYRDSFLLKTSSSLTGGSGVVFHDRIRATPGYHMVDHYLHSPQCSFADKPHSESFVFPGSLCTVLGDGAAIGYSSGQLTFWRADGLLGWKRKVHVHHDISVDETEGTIFVISGDFVQPKGEKKSTRYDAVRGYDLKGNEIFYWSMKEQLRDFEAILRKKLSLRFSNPYFQYSHFNSVQEIPRNPIETQLTAFRAGNILVNDFFYGLIFVIDRDTKKIAWHYFPEGGVSAHSVRLNEQGQIVFLANNKSEREGQNPTYSAIDFLNPATKKIEHSITLSPKEGFFSPYWGSMQILPGNRFLVTNSLAGSALEIDHTGRIFWEWVSPMSKPPQYIHPVYRVKLVPRASAEKMLSAWNPF